MYHYFSKKKYLFKRYERCDTFVCCSSIECSSCPHDFLNTLVNIGTPSFIFRKVACKDLLALNIIITLIENIRFLAWFAVMVSSNNILLIGLLLRGSGHNLCRIFGYVGCFKPNKRLYHSWHHPLHSHAHPW